MITLIFIGDLKYCPYLRRYTERLEIVGAEYEVLLWARTDPPGDHPSNYYYYESPAGLQLGAFAKLKAFNGYRKWVVSHLSKRKPDGIVLLSTLAGVMLFNHLKSIPYIFDIRDYSLEHIAPFYYIEKKVIKGSYFTAISSRGFESFLPKHDYVMAHNFNRNDIIKGASFRPSKKIKIVWCGLVRFFDNQRLLIDAIKNDERFELYYHGDGPEVPKFIEYCKANKVNNVYLTGSYSGEKKYELIKDADILNNCYFAPGNLRLDRAISNKFYDGLIIKRPQLVETDNYKAQLVEQLGVGLPIDFSNKNLADKIYDYYRSLDNSNFDEKCNLYLQTVLKDDDYYIRMIDKFIQHTNK